MQNLKYLFVACFSDGSILDQPPADVSKTDPKKSAFFDVLQRESEITSFHLFEADPEHDAKKFSVSLQDGSFCVNGVRFKMHDEELTDFKLIFFRKHDHRINQQVIFDGKGGLTPGQVEELSHTITYRIGWQAHNHMGQNVQRIMEIR